MSAWRRTARSLRAALRSFLAGGRSGGEELTLARALVTAGMFLAGFVGFAQVYAPNSAVEWTDTLFRTAQLVVGEFPQELLPAPGAPRIAVPAILNTARFALPLLVLWLAISGLVRRIRAPLRAAGAAMMSDHLILAGGGEAVAGLLAEAKAAGRRVLVIGATADPGAGAVAIPGDARDPGTWRNLGLSRACSVAIVGLGDADAFAATLAAAEVAREERDVGAAPVALVAAIEDADLRALLDSLFRGRDPVDGVVLSATSPARLHARALLQQHPLHRGIDVGAGEPVHVLVVGFGRTGQEIALEVLKIGMTGEDRLPRVTVVDPDAARLSRVFRQRHGGADPLDRIAFVAQALEPADGEAMAALCARVGPVGAIYLCLPDGTDALLLAVALRRWAAAQGRWAPPLYLRAHAAPELGRQLAQASLGDVDLTRIHVFGHDPSATLNTLTGDALDRPARRIHERYLGQGLPAERSPAQRPWAMLPELYRQANRDQADYLPMRLAALGLGIVPAEEGEPIAGAVLERGARAEHARWRSAAALAGWKLGPRDDLALRHPDLIPYDALDERGHDKDRAVLRGIADQLPDGLAVAPLRVRALAAVDAPSATLVEATLDTPGEARALRAAVTAHPGLRWRLRLDPATPARLRRWTDDAARRDALWLIDHAEQVLPRIQ